MVGLELIMLPGEVVAPLCFSRRGRPGITFFSLFNWKLKENWLREIKTT